MRNTGPRRLFLASVVRRVSRRGRKRVPHGPLAAGNFLYARARKYFRARTGPSGTGFSEDTFRDHPGPRVPAKYFRESCGPRGCRRTSRQIFWCCGPRTASVMLDLVLARYRDHGPLLPPSPAYARLDSTLSGRGIFWTSPLTWRHVPMFNT